MRAGRVRPAPGEHPARRGRSPAGAAQADDAGVRLGNGHRPDGRGGGHWVALRALLPAGADALSKSALRAGADRYRAERPLYAACHSPSRRPRARAESLDARPARIVHDLEQLPYVSSARVERQFPDHVTIHIQERVPVAKISGLNVDINTRETFYLDRDCIVLTPRADEPDPGLRRSSA